MGRITAKQIDSFIGEYIAPDSLGCNDSAKNYIAFAKLKGLEHKQINASKKKRVIGRYIIFSTSILIMAYLKPG